MSTKTLRKMIAKGDYFTIFGSSIEEGTPFRLTEWADDGAVAEMYKGSKTFIPNGVFAEFSVDAGDMSFVLFMAKSNLTAAGIMEAFKASQNIDIDDFAEAFSGRCDCPKCRADRKRQADLMRGGETVN